MTTSELLSIRLDKFYQSQPLGYLEWRCRMLVKKSSAYRIVAIQCRMADNRRFVLRRLFHHARNSAGLQVCPIAGMEDARLAFDAANVNHSIPVCVVFSHLGRNLPFYGLRLGTALFARLIDQSDFPFRSINQ